MRFENIQVKHIGEEKTGVSVTTGNKWSSRTILLGWTEQDGGQGYVNAVASGEVWAKSANIEVGDLVSAELSFRTNRFRTGYVANEVRILNIQKV